jgi:hypothetical protein
MKCTAVFNIAASSMYTVPSIMLVNKDIISYTECLNQMGKLNG